jgi:hypothetical protein
MAQDWQKLFRDIAQEHISEPVIAAGILSPAGSMAGFGLSKISPVAGLAKNRQANRRAGSLGHDGVFKVRQALIAVTASKIYGFNSKPKGRKGWQIVDQIAEWDRSDVRVSFDDQHVTRTVTLEIISTGDRHELEMVQMAGALTDPRFAALAATP